MAPRTETKTISKKVNPEEPSPDMFTQRKRPEVGQFRLQVDRQTKGSYATAEAAEAAGLAIKKAHPIVQVAIYELGDEREQDPRAAAGLMMSLAGGRPPRFLPPSIEE